MAATLGVPTGITVDGNGDVYFADKQSNVIRKVDSRTLTITTVAGRGSYAYGGNGGPAMSASLKYPVALAFDVTGNLFIADHGNGLIRKVERSSGIITTVAGNLTSTDPSDGIPATSAGIGAPDAIAIDAAGNIYFDATVPGDHYVGNTKIRRVDASTGNISTVAGGGPTIQSSMKSVLATSARTIYISTLAIDSSGSLYIGWNGILSTVSSENESLDFLPIPEGDATTSLVTATNIGNQPLAFANASLAGSTPDFALRSDGIGDCTSTTVLQPSLSCDIRILFAPSSQLFSDTTLTLSNNSLNRSSSQVIKISGGPVLTSFAFAISPDLTANPTQFTVTALDQIGNTFDYSGPLTMTYNTYAALSTSYVSAIMLHGTGTFSAALSSGTYLFGTILGAANGSSFFRIPIALTYTPRINLVSSATTGVNSFVRVDVLDSRGQLASDFSGVVSLSFSDPSAPPISYRYSLADAGTHTFAAVFGASGVHTITASVASQGFVSATVSVPTSVPGGMRFIPVTPCRISDTRELTGPFGGPLLRGQSSRNFVIPNSSCGIPVEATAYSPKPTVVPKQPLQWVTLWPTGQTQPLVSTLNSMDGRIKANAAVVGAGVNGAVSIFATDDTDVVLDINGYFVPSTTPTALAFYTLTPCRIADTRWPTGPLGAPMLKAGQTRDFSVLTSACHVPANARAYALNFTAVPKEALGYLTAWPADQSRPNVSTLNAPTATVTANAAVVPAGSNGNISVYSTGDTDVIIDVNGYFAPPQVNALSFYPAVPCRILDTRTQTPAQRLMGVREVTPSPACSVPAETQAFVLNATVLPVNSLDWLALWPDTETQPDVSTLNAYDGAITSNMAIVPTIEWPAKRIRFPNSTSDPRHIGILCSLIGARRSTFDPKRCGRQVFE